MKTQILLLAIIALQACSGNTEKSAEHQAEHSNLDQEPAAMQAQAHAQATITQDFNLTEGKNMANAFQNIVGTDNIKTLNFPKSFIFEKAFVENLLSEVSNQGGLLIYPVINPTTGQFSLAFAAAQFDTDENNNYSGGVIEARYPNINSVPSVYEAITPCPKHCPSASTDLFNK